MNEIIKICGCGIIIKSNVKDVMENVFLNIENFINRDVFILVSKNVKAYSDLAYSNGQINYHIYSKIRIKKDLLDSELEVIEINNFDGILTIIAKMDNY